MTCQYRVTKVRGVAPDARGIVSLRLIGFRGHCECGWLGEKRDNWFNARGDGERHVRKSAFAVVA